MTYTNLRRKNIRTTAGQRAGSDAIKLSVYGTCDEFAGILGRWKFFMQLVTVVHPEDSRYTRQAYVLNEKGKRYLNRKKKE